MLATKSLLKNGIDFSQELISGWVNGLCGQTVTVTSPYTLTLLQRHARSGLVGDCFWEPSTPSLWV